MALRLLSALTPADVDAAVEEAVEAHTPGIELGYASRTTTYTFNSTAVGVAAVEIPGLTVTVTGQGRPVDVRFYCSAVYHAVTANTFVGASVNTGDPTGTNAQIGSRASHLPNNGPSMTIDYRTGILTLGQSYTFQVSVWSTATGNASFVAAGYCPMELSVTSR